MVILDGRFFSIQEHPEPARSVGPACGYADLRWPGKAPDRITETGLKVGGRQPERDVLPLSGRVPSSGETFSMLRVLIYSVLFKGTPPRSQAHLNHRHIENMSRQLDVEKINGKPGEVYYPIRLVQVPKPTPGPNEYLVKMRAAALNHRDFFIRQHLYPRISFSTPILADGYGTVIEAGPGANSSLLDCSVLLTPSRGWLDDPEGPEDYNRFAVLGASSLYPPLGMAQDYIVVHECEVEPTPSHLSAAEAAALPVVGLTAWRALVTKSGNARRGQNILVTGIGGGVALQTLQFAIAKGCNVWVTSGDETKITKAVTMGARGGVRYKQAGWEKALAMQLPSSRPYLDAIIDGAGGDIMAKAVRLLKPGGVVSCYGMTVSPRMDWLMPAVLRNLELRGSTMGSRAEFKDMVDFVRQEKIKPMVSKIVKGLDDLQAIERLFDDLRDGNQFGKLVIEISPDTGKAKL